MTLANKLACVDLEPGNDVTARFSSNLNGSPTCLGGNGWYLGFDNNHGTNVDLLPVMPHGPTAAATSR